MLSFRPAIPSRSDVDWCWYLRRQGVPGEQLERVLHDIGVLYPDGWADWSPSALSSTGAPVEMLFSIARGGLTLTTEVANPTHDKASRLAQVCEVMSDLGGTPPAPALRDVMYAAQSDGELRFGAWLELHTTGMRIHARLIVDLPAASTDLCGLMGPTYLAELTDVLGGQTHATRLVYCGTTGQITMHYESHGVQRSILPALAERAQVSPDILSMSLDGLIEQAPDASLPTRTLHFSYRESRKNEPPQLSLYFPARQLFGSDTRTARRIKACGGRAMNGYGAMLDTLCPAPNGQMHHGTVGLTARQNAAPFLSVSVAAPWNCSQDLV